MQIKQGFGIKVPALLLIQTALCRFFCWKNQGWILYPTPCFEASTLTLQDCNARNNKAGSSMQMPSVITVPQQEHEKINLTMSVRNIG